MTSRDFAFWLQGYFEILDPSGTVQVPMGSAQVEVIRKHLHLVFKHEISPPQPVGFKPHTTTTTIPTADLQQGDKGYRFPSQMQQATAGKWLDPNQWVSYC